jgi:hypothetical protein
LSPKEATKAVDLSPKEATKAVDLSPKEATKAGVDVRDNVVSGVGYTRLKVERERCQ